jgi:hypothetical protein
MQFNEFDEFFGGISFMYPIDQDVLILDTKKTGRVLGVATNDNDYFQHLLVGYYIVRLDQPTPDAKAILVHENNLRLLTCHWCQDSQQVPVTPFTMEQYETNTIPTKPCPECQREAYMAYMEKAVTCG